MLPLFGEIKIIILVRLSCIEVVDGASSNEDILVPNILFRSWSVRISRSSFYWDIILDLRVDKP